MYDSMCGHNPWPKKFDSNYQPRRTMVKYIEEKWEINWFIEGNIDNSDMCFITIWMCRL